MRDFARPGMTALAVLWLSGPAAAQVGGFETAMVGWFQSIERMISGIAVNTKQESTSSGQQATVSNEVKKAAAETMLDVDRRMAVREAQQKFESMQTAVAGLCNDVQTTKEADKAKALSGTISTNLGSAERDWNRDGGSRTEVLAQSQALRAGPLCPAGEAALGLCDKDAGKYVGGFPAGDTDPATFLLSGQYGKRTYGTAEAEVGMIYADTLLPMVTMKSKAEAAKAGVSGLVDRADARHQQAIISLGRKALTDVILRGIEGGVAGK